MATETIDTFLDELSEPHREALTTFIVAFDFSEKRAALRESFAFHHSVEHEFDFGPPVGKKTFLISADPDVAAQQIQNIMSHPAAMENSEQRDFLEYIEREEVQCVIPNLETIQGLHRDHPIFGFLIAHHDLQCDACGFNGPEGYEEREQLAIQTIAAMSEEDQGMLVGWGRSVAEILFARQDQWESLIEGAREEIMPEEREIDPAELYRPEEIGGLILGPLWIALHHWIPCPLAAGIGEDLLLWFVRQPYFFRDLIFHAGECDVLRCKCKAFERSMIAGLPESVKAAYLEASIILSHGKNSVFE